MTDPKQNYFFRPIQQSFFILMIGLAVLVVAAAIHSTRWIIVAAAMGIGLGVLILPAMDYMREKLKVPHGISALVFLLLFFGGVGGLGYLIYAVTSTQIAPLVDRAPEILASARSTANQWLGKIPFLQNQLSNFNFDKAFQGVGSYFVSGITIGFAAMGGLLFVITTALYLAVNPRTYQAGFLSLFPAHMRPEVSGDMRACAVNLRKWFFAQVLAAGSVGALTALSLWAIGVEYWPQFGILTFFLDFVPYLGPILACALISLITLGSQPELVPWVLLVFFIMQQIEGDLILPLIMKGRMELPPIQLITLMLMFGTWFGVLGVFIAPPLMTLFRTIYLRQWVPRMEARTRPLYEEPLPTEAKLKQAG